IIHRDVRPQNLMLDRDTNHIKLTDFGYAIACNMNNKGRKIRIVGPLTYATQSFLDVKLKILTRELPKDHYYCYEPTFDLISALNIIMTVTNADIKRKIDSIDILEDKEEIVSQSLQLWKDTQRTNKHYSNLLNLINKLDTGDSFYESGELSVFDVSKDELIESDESSIFNVSKNQSDPSAIFDVIKDEVENFSIYE
ncbi:unnamed protein product, partial [Rotaria sp. Silwood1]